MKLKTFFEKNKKPVLICGAAAVALLLAVILPLRFCGNKTGDADAEATEEPAETIEPQDTPSPVPTFSPTSEPAPSETPEPTAEPELTPFPAPKGMVAASKRLTYGLSSVGLLSYTGVTNGRCACYDWRSVIYIVTNDNFTAALTEEGKVLVAGDDALAGRTADWTDIVELCCSDSAVYGLKSDGTVLSTNNTTNGLKNVRTIAASGNYVISIDEKGGYFALGGVPDFRTFLGRGVIKLAAAPDHLVGMTAEGELLSTRENDPFIGVSDCTAVFAGKGCTAYIDGEGRLHTDCALCIGEEGGTEAVFDDGCWFAAAAEHAVIMHRDGTVTAFGGNDYYECRIDSWRLAPYLTDDGFVLGIAPGSADENGDPIRTGDEYALWDGTVGTAVILGDIDCDGQITQADIDLLRSHMSGASQLSAASKQAANIIREPSRPNAIDAADLEQLRYHLLGYTVIDQYAKEFTYMAKVCAAERTNRDTCGYISIAGTNIDAPLMYGDDFYYHYHSPSGASSSNGSIYLYYNYPSKNTVITGHNLRKSGTMLHDLHKIQDQYSRAYATYTRRLWSINLFGETALYEVFAMYEEKPSDPSKSSQYYNCCYNYTMERLTRENIEEWIRTQKQRSEFGYSVNVTPDDRFVTVLTCSDTHAESERGGRIYFFLRRVDGH